MKNVISSFKQIMETSGSNDKISIIGENKDNELFKKCLVFLCDTSVITGIKKTSLKKKVNQIMDCPILDFEELMNYLKENNTGRDSDIAICKCYINSQDEEDRWFYEGMITKSLKLGCNQKSINKAIPNLIHKHEVMLGSPYDKLKLKDGETFFISQKMNGNRCSWIGDKLISRQGKEWKGLDHIVQDIKKLKLNDFFIDGELIRKNVDNVSDGENFRIGTGVLNSDVEDKTCIEFVIFDMFPLKEWKKDGCSTSKYGFRKKTMEGLIDVIKDTNLRIVPFFYEGTDQAQIMKWLDYAVEHDMEGLMLAKDSIYESKRTANLIKVKKFLTCDLRIVGYTEGDGKLKGTLGALVVEYKGNTVNVGSGYSDEDRARLWGGRDNLVDRIVEVKYKEETVDKKTGLSSIQFPVFVCLREIGKEVSYN